MPLPTLDNTNNNNTSLSYSLIHQLLRTTHPARTLQLKTNYERLNQLPNYRNSNYFSMYIQPIYICNMMITDIMLCSVMQIDNVKYAQLVLDNTLIINEQQLISPLQPGTSNKRANDIDNTQSKKRRKTLGVCSSLFIKQSAVLHSVQLDNTIKQQSHELFNNKYNIEFNDSMDITPIADIIVSDTDNVDTYSQSHISIDDDSEINRINASNQIMSNDNNVSQQTGNESDSLYHNNAVSTIDDSNDNVLCADINNNLVFSTCNVSSSNHRSNNDKFHLVDLPISDSTSLYCDILHRLTQPIIDELQHAKFQPIRTGYTLYHLSHDTFNKLLHKLFVDRMNAQGDHNSKQITYFDKLQLQIQYIQHMYNLYHAIVHSSVVYASHLSALFLQSHQNNQYTKYIRQIGQLMTHDVEQIKLSACVDGSAKLHYTIQFITEHTNSNNDKTLLIIVQHIELIWLIHSTLAASNISTLVLNKQTEHILNSGERLIDMQCMISDELYIFQHATFNWSKVKNIILYESLPSNKLPVRLKTLLDSNLMTMHILQSNMNQLYRSIYLRYEQKKKFEPSTCTIVNQLLSVECIDSLISVGINVITHALNDIDIILDENTCVKLIVIDQTPLISIIDNDITKLQQISQKYSMFICIVQCMNQSMLSLKMQLMKMKLYLKRLGTQCTLLYTCNIDETVLNISKYFTLHKMDTVDYLQRSWLQYSITNDIPVKLSKISYVNYYVAHMLIDKTKLTIKQLHNISANELQQKLPELSMTLINHIVQLSTDRHLIDIQLSGIPDDSIVEYKSDILTNQYNEPLPALQQQHDQPDYVMPAQPSYINNQYDNNDLFLQASTQYQQQQYYNNQIHSNNMIDNQNFHLHIEPTYYQPPPVPQCNQYPLQPNHMPSQSQQLMQYPPTQIQPHHNMMQSSHYQPQPTTNLITSNVQHQLPGIRMQQYTTPISVNPYQAPPNHTQHRINHAHNVLNNSQSPNHNYTLNDYNNMFNINNLQPLTTIAQHHTSSPYIPQHNQSISLQSYQSSTTQRQLPHNTNYQISPAFNRAAHPNTNNQTINEYNYIFHTNNLQAIQKPSSPQYNNIASTYQPRPLISPHRSISTKPPIK